MAIKQELITTHDVVLTKENNYINNKLQSIDNQQKDIRGFLYCYSNADQELVKNS